MPFANEGQARRNLDTQSKSLVAELRQYPVSESGVLFARFMQESGADLYLLDKNHNPINLFTFSAADDKTESGQEYPFRFADSDNEYLLVVQFNSARSVEIVNAILHGIPWVGSVILVLSFLSAFFFSRYTTRPIVRMSKIAANIAESDFSWYCPDLRGDEIGTLAKSINELSDKLSTSLSKLRRQNSILTDEITLEKERERRRLLFFSAVSHELKTPVAIVIGQLEGMQAKIGVYKDRDKYMARSAEILRSLDNFIREILSVSYMDIVDKKMHDSVNLSDMLESVIKDRRILMDARSIKVETKIQPDILVPGDAALLQKALENVISNAVLYSPKSGLVTIRLTNKKNEATLAITNSGAHIAEEHLPHLFEAFYRVDQHTGGSGQGSGLGLYITRMILESYGVSHTIKNSNDGVIFTAVFKAS